MLFYDVSVFKSSYDVTICVPIWEQYSFFQIIFNHLLREPFNNCLLYLHLCESTILKPMQEVREP